MSIRFGDVGFHGHQQCDALGHVISSLVTAECPTKVLFRVSVQSSVGAVECLPISWGHSARGQWRTSPLYINIIHNYDIFWFNMCLDPKFNIQLIIETLSKTPTAIFQQRIQWYSMDMDWENTLHPKWYELQENPIELGYHVNLKNEWAVGTMACYCSSSTKFCIFLSLRWTQRPNARNCQHKRSIWDCLAGLRLDHKMHPEPLERKKQQCKQKHLQCGHGESLGQVLE